MKHEAKLAIVVFIWGVNYLIVPFGVGAMGAGPFTLIRFAATVPILYAMMWWRQDFRVERSDWGKMVLIGLTGTSGYQAAFAAAVDLTSTVNAAILFSLSPIFSVLLNYAMGREKPALINWIGLLIAFVGGAVIVTRDGGLTNLASGHQTGDALMLLAAFLWALTALLSEGCLKKYGGLKTTAWSLPAGVVGLVFFAGHPLLSLHMASVPASAWCSLAFAILGATVIGVVMFYDVLPHLGTRQVMSSMYLIPVVAIVCSCAWNRTWLTAAEIAGIALALSGVVLARRNAAYNSLKSVSVTVVGSPAGAIGPSPKETQNV